jgi:hypothetical protein
MDAFERIEAYFADCGAGSATEIGSHFTANAVIYDTNLRPAIGRDAIGAMWVKVRERWLGATWRVDSFVGDTDHAAIEWTMTGQNPADGRAFAFRGSEHYLFAPTASERPGLDLLISEIRQYWTFDPDKLDTGLVDYPYP